MIELTICVWLQPVLDDIEDLCAMRMKIMLQTDVHDMI